MQYRHGFALDQVDQVAGIPVPTRPRKHEPAPGDQGPEEFPDRHIEAERRLLEDRVAGGKRVSLLHPQQPVHDPAVRVPRALRPAGRSRGIDHVGRVGGTTAPIERSRTLAGQQRPVAVEADRDPVERRQPGQKARLGDQDRWRGVVQHEPETIRRILGIERNVRPARLQNRHQGNHHVERPLGAHPDQRSRNDAKLPKPAGQLIGAGVEFLVALGRVSESHGLGRWRSGGLLLQ